MLQWLLSVERSSGHSPETDFSPVYREFRKSKQASLTRAESSLFLVKTFYSPSAYRCRSLPSKRPGSLRLLFNYYSTLLQPSQVFCGTGVARGLTYSDIQEANSHVSLPELTRFAKTFGIVPNLLSVHGVHYAWQRQKFENVGRENSTMLDYDGFVEVLARCALLAFPGLDEPRERVRALADFLDLENTRKYRVTLAAMKRLEQIKLKPTEEHSEIHSRQVRESAMPQRGKGSSTRAATSNMLGEVLEAGTVAKLRTKLKSSVDYSYVPISKPKWKQIRVSKKLEKHLPGACASVAVEKAVEERTLCSGVLKIENTKRNTRECMPVPTSRPRTRLLRAKRLLNSPVTDSKRLPSTTEARTKVAFCKQDVHYTGNLLAELEPYRFENTPVQWLPYEELYIDMGDLKLGSTYRYKIQVLNTMSHKTVFEFYIRNIPGGTITFDPRDAAAGIERTAVVKLQTTKVGEFLGHVECLALSTCGHEIERVIIPVYCNVSPLEHQSSNGHALPSRTPRPLKPTLNANLALISPDQERQEDKSPLPLSLSPLSKATKLEKVYITGNEQDHAWNGIRATASV